MRISFRPESVRKALKLPYREGDFISSSVNLFMQFVETYSARCSTRVISTVYS